MSGFFLWQLFFNTLENKQKTLTSQQGFSIDLKV